MEDLTNKIGKDFGAHFGREYKAVESFNINKDTKLVIVTMSSITTTARGVIKNHPDVGLLKLRLFKPFPKQSVLEALEDLPDDAIIAPIERNFLGDKYGATIQELMRAFYNERNFRMYDFYTGLGGKDVPPLTIEKIIYKAKNNPKDVNWIDLEY